MCGYILIKNNSNLKTGLKKGGALESLGRAYSLATETSWDFTLGSVSSTKKKRKKFVLSNILLNIDQKSKAYVSHFCEMAIPIVRLPQKMQHVASEGLESADY